MDDQKIQFMEFLPGEMAPTFKDLETLLSDELPDLGLVGGLEGELGMSLSSLPGEKFIDPLETSSVSSGSAKLKKTCEACVKLKVKCCGKQPCDRCTRAGRQCLFLPRRPRILTKPYKKRKKPGFEKKLKLFKEENNTESSQSSQSLFEFAQKKKNEIARKVVQDVQILLCSSDSFINRFNREGRMGVIQKREEPAMSEQETAVIDPVTFERYSLNEYERLQEEFAWDLYSKICRHYLPVHQYGSLYHLLHRSVKSLKDNFGLFFGMRSERICSDVHLLLSDLRIDLDKFFQDRLNYLRINHPDREEISEEMLKDFSLLSRFQAQLEESKRALVPLPAPSGHLLAEDVKYMLACKGLVVQMMQKFYTETPIAVVRTRMKSVYMPSMRPVDVVVNRAFENVFAKSERDICMALMTRVSGFLPFGSSLLSLLSADDEKLVTFLEVQCVKGTVIDVYGKIPKYSEMPNVSVMALNARKFGIGLDLTPRLFQVTVVVRRLQDEKSMIEESIFEFSPIDIPFSSPNSPRP